MKGKKERPRPGRERPSPAESGCGAGCSVRPGAALERTVLPRYRGQSACAAGAGIAGGTAEGLPFVPISWEEGLLCPNRKEELDNGSRWKARPRLG